MRMFCVGFASAVINQRNPRLNPVKSSLNKRIQAASGAQAEAAKKKKRKYMNIQTDVHGRQKGSKNVLKQQFWYGNDTRRQELLLHPHKQSERERVVEGGRSQTAAEEPNELTARA